MIRVGGALILALVTAPLSAGAQGAGAATDTVASRGPTPSPTDTVADAAAPPATEPGPPPAPVLPRHWRGTMFRPDRLQHASLAFGLGVGVGMLSRTPAAGAGVAVGLGFAKELADDHFDRGDFAADVIGAGLAALVVAALTR
jgi:hypothetical protein